MKPMYDRVLVERIEEKNEGIEITKSKGDNLFHGIVMEVGDGYRVEHVVPEFTDNCQKLKVKKGDKVVFPHFAGTLFQDGEIVYYIVREEDILVRMEG